MPITINSDKPPPYVVTTSHGPEDTTHTHAFGTIEEARAFYRLAHASGTYTMTLPRGKRKGLTLVLASLWRRETYQRVDTGEDAVCYVEVPDSESDTQQTALRTSPGAADSRRPSAGRWPTQPGTQDSGQQGCGA